MTSEEQSRLVEELRQEALRLKGSVDSVVGLIYSKYQNGTLDIPRKYEVGATDWLVGILIERYARYKAKISEGVALARRDT